MSETLPLFDPDDDVDQVTAFNDNFPHHGRAYGYRLGCRCQNCKNAKSTSRFINDKQIVCLDCGVKYWYRQSFTGKRRCENCEQPYRRAKEQEALIRRQPRPCHKCGTHYLYSSRSKHGTKYCENCLLTPSWQSKRNLPVKECKVCLQPQINQNRYDICSQCRSVLPEAIWDALHRHKAPLEVALYVASVLACEICGCDIVSPRKDNKGRMRLDYSIDHDHACCQGATSCGKCIRGVLCRRCNIGIGYLQNNPQAAAAAATYLYRSERPQI